MKKTTVTIYCDLCKKEGAKNYRTLVRFHTDQNDGMTVTPYLTECDIDLCEECTKKVIVLEGRGAQGHNDFWVGDRR